MSTLREICVATKATTEGLIAVEPKVKEELGELILEFRNKKGNSGPVKETLNVIGVKGIENQILETWPEELGASEFSRFQVKVLREAAFKLVLEEIRGKFEELEEEETWKKLLSGEFVKLEIRVLEELISECLKESSGKGGGRLSKEIILEYFEEEILVAYLKVLEAKGLEKEKIQKQLNLVKVCFSKLSSPNVGLKEEFLEVLLKINELNKENSNLGVKEKIKLKIELEILKLKELKKSGEEILMI